MVGVGRDLCGSSSPTLQPKQGHLQQVGVWRMGRLTVSRAYVDAHHPLLSSGPSWSSQPGLWGDGEDGAAHSRIGMGWDGMGEHCPVSGPQTARSPCPSSRGAVRMLCTKAAAFTAPLLWPGSSRCHVAFSTTALSSPPCFASCFFSFFLRKHLEAE